MDILYTLGRGSTWQDNELRYSLRSIVKYGKNVGHIYLVGDWCPSFVNLSEVTFIKCAQPYNDKFHNILYSIVYACEHSDIAEEFLLSSDDHFYIEKTDFDNYPYWLKAPELPDNCFTGYRRHLWETRQLLEKYGYEYRNYAQHCNTHFVKSVLLAHKDIIEESFQLVKGVEATCLMLNILQKERPFESVFRDDIKLKEEKKRSQINQVLNGRDCFSISDRVIPLVRPILENLFPSPCRYEKSASCCVVIPIYKDKFSPGEEMSVDRTTDVLSSRPIYFFAPENLNTSYYEKRYKGVGIKRFEDSYFESIDGYTRLLCTPMFYEAFSDYEFMLIDQPDCWTFRDDLNEFCAMGYDYIGAPWPAKKGVPKWRGVGNGGFCLRRISKFIDVAGKRENTENLPEDWFFCVKCARDLNIAPMDVASHFSLEICPEAFYYKFGGVLPMGCHKPYAYHYEKFWKRLGVPNIK